MRYHYYIYEMWYIDIYPVQHEMNYLNNCIIIYTMNKLNYGLFLISSHNTIRDTHEIVIQKKTFNKSINKTRNINQQTHKKTVL